MKPVKKAESSMNYAVNQSSDEVLQHPTAFTNDILFIGMCCLTVTQTIGLKENSAPPAPLANSATVNTLTVGGKKRRQGRGLDTLCNMPKLRK